MANYTELRAQLETRLADIRQRVGRIEGDLRRTADPDWVEQATERENDEVLQGLDEMGRAEVTQLRDALRRIDAGSYGVCVSCQKPIQEERLRAVPTAATCISCAK